MPLEIGAKIGIFGGGQLGQMLCHAAFRLGYKTHVFVDSEDSPAAQAASEYTIADYSDLKAVKTFAKHVDLITYEFENIPVETVNTAEAITPVAPGVNVLETSQDRLLEKTFIQDNAGVDVTPFKAIKSAADTERFLEKNPQGLVLKTRRMGYDGKGQAIIRSIDDIDTAHEKLGDVPLIAESFIPFVREVSVVSARSVSGEVTAYPLIENVHKNHILYTSKAPASGDDGKAPLLARKILNALDYVGVMAVEFFELADGSLLVNEIAPRVHNSGHWTLNAGCIDQFELHIRAIADLPLGDTTPKHNVEMLNLIGEDVNQTNKFAAKPKHFIHLYGKSEIRAGRKMGHVNRILS